MTRIEGKVAEIISDRDLVINRGKVDGVTVGMQFRILHSRGAAIKDPDTQEIIGQVEIDKTVVKITSVDERIAVGRTFRTIKEGGGAFGSLYANNLFKPPTVSVETLKTGGKNAKNDLAPEQSFVKIGDKAVQLTVPDTGAEVISSD
jgi:hypothetical protein